LATWVGTIVETKGRPDFWERARVQGVHANVTDVPAHALVECEIRFDVSVSIRLAEAISRDISVECLAFVLQTTGGVQQFHAFREGKCVRRLGYSRDEGGWLENDGPPAAWEPSYFFGGGAADATSDQWPDMLDDELSAEQIARYEAARQAGDARPVLDLLNPSSTEGMIRVCKFFGCRPDHPAGSWRKPSLLSRILGRR
jgi:hypothetical protein